MTRLRRVWKFLKWTLGILLILILLLGFTLTLPAVQTRLARFAVGYLDDEFGIEVQIEKASIQLPNVVVLKGVYAPDHRGDTLIFANSIRFEYRGFNQNTLSAGEIELNEGKLRMRNYEEDSLYNFAIWLENFNTGDTTTSENPFTLSIADIVVTDFSYLKEAHGCDWCTTLQYENADLLVSDFLLEGSYLSGDVEMLRYTDPLHFNLYQFAAHAEVQSTYMELTDLTFETDSSNVKGWARLEYRDMSQFNDFLNKVRVRGQFEEATIESNEFRSYIPEFPQFDQFFISGTFDGVVNDFKATNVDASVGGTSFFGDVHLTDCTEPDNLFLDAYVGYCKTSGNDLRYYLDQFLDDELPELVANLSQINLSGHYDGTLASFHADGDLTTSLGDAEVDLKFDDITNIENVVYEGLIELNDFDLGHLLGIPQLGKVTTEGSVSGTGFTPKSLSAIVDVQAQSAVFNNYKYHQIDIDGDIEGGMFSGDFSINDRNVELVFDGVLDLRSDTAQFDFIATIENTDLHQLGFIKDTASRLNAMVIADFALYKDEWWQGQVEVDSVEYERGNRVYGYNQLLLNSSNAGNITRNAITSDIVDGYLEGKYKLQEIHKPILRAISTVSKHIESPEEVPDVDCDFQFTLKKTDHLFELLVPGYRIAPNTMVSGRIASENDVLSLKMETPGLDLQGIYFDTTQVRLKGTSGAYNLTTNIRSIFTSGEFDTDDIRFSAKFRPDSSLVDIGAILRDSVDSDIRFKGYVQQPSLTSALIHWDQAVFNVGIDTLVLQRPNKLLIDSSRLVFNNYAFIGNNGTLRLDGTLSAQPYEVLRARIDNIDLSLLNYLLREPNTYFTGQADGMIVLNDMFGSPNVAGALYVDSLGLNQQQLGDLDLNIDWDIANNVQKLVGGITLGTRQTFNVSGRVALDSLEPIRVKLDLSRFRLAAFNPYLQGVLDNLRGTVEGSILIAGTLQKPTLSGDLELPNAAFSIPFLGTDYNFEGSPVVHLSSDRILVDRVKIRDTKEGTSGYASGVINHKNLSDLNFDLEIDAREMLGMDLEEGVNEYFYGKAYASGRVRIVGPTDQMNLRVDVEAEKGTSVRLPISSTTEVGKSEFVTFVDPTVNVDSTAFGFFQKSQIENLGGLSITVNAFMKPDAEVRLVGENTIGGEIIGEGDGLIKIDLSPTGELSILGNYAVSTGTYKFNLRNIVVRDFDILSGSTLQWTGDPFGAQIDMTAEYSTKTTLNGVITESQGYSGQRVKVLLLMHLTGDLMNPNIEFDIDLPDVQTSWKEIIRNRLSDKDKMTENAFAILATNNFWLSDNSSIIGDVGQQSVDQMASLMSNWAAKSIVGDLADINVNYQTFSNSELVGSEFELGVSRTLFDDRLTANTNVDIPVDVQNSVTGESQVVTADFEIEYKITEDGKFRAKAFNRSNQNNPALNNLSSYSQGVSVFYRTDFDTWTELIEEMFGRPLTPLNDSTDKASIQKIDSTSAMPGASPNEAVNQQNNEADRDTLETNPQSQMTAPNPKGSEAPNETPEQPSATSNDEGISNREQNEVEEQ